MEFRQALKEIVIGKNVNLDDEASDKAVLVNFASYCADNSEILQLQELKNILSTGVFLGHALLQAYCESKNAGDSSYTALADKIEEIADELERNHISCFSYAYFISCYLELFQELFQDDDFIKLNIDSVAWIDPEKYDYGYQFMPTAESTFGFGRYRASIKEFKIESGVLVKYAGRDPHVIIPYFVKSIGEGAFADNKKIKSVYIPCSVTKIGAEAFCGCEKLETVVLSEAVTRLYSATFEGCKLLTRINLSSITVVGSRCFKGCVMIERIDAPLLTKVGDEAFSCCIGLKNAGFVSRLTEIGDKAFERCSMNSVSLESCFRLGSQAFLDCTVLTRIVLNSNIVSMGVTPFKGCTAVTLLNITGDSYAGYVHDLFSDSLESFNQQNSTLSCIKKDSLKRSEFAGYRCIKEVEIRNADAVPDQAFADCVGLTVVKFDLPIRAIGESAFASCGELTDVDMHFVGEEIPTKAFYKCSKLNVKDLLSTASVYGDFALAYTDLSAFSFVGPFKHIGAFAFANAKFPSQVSLNLSGCKVLPGAFHGVNEIKTLRLDSIQAIYRGQLHMLFDPVPEDFVAKRKINCLFINGTISAQSFKNYSNIRCVEFAVEEGKIPTEAFAHCTALESVKVNGAVSLIEPYAFFGCSSLSLLDMQYDSVVVERESFRGCRHIHGLIDLSRITHFGEYAFADSDVTELNLSEKVQVIGKSAFSACADIKTVVLPFVGCTPENAQDEAGRFGAIFGTEKFDNCSMQCIEDEQGCVNYCIPGNVKRITVLSKTLSEGCFDGCGFLTELYLPNVVDFSTSCFKGCEDLRSVYLGESLENFSATAVLGCERTVRFDISSACEMYMTIHGTVLSKNKDKLYFLDSTDNLTNHIASIRAIGTNAVAEAPEVVELPSTIIEIDSRAINCVNVRSISVDTVENIKESAFYNCDVLESISITNSAAQRVFACNGSQLNINCIHLTNAGLSSVSELFFEIDDVVINTLCLDGVSIDGEEFFEKVSSVQSVEIMSAIKITRGCMHGADIYSLSMCGQCWLVSELLGDESTLPMLRMYNTEIHRDEFRGVAIEELDLEDVTTIHSGAFAGASVGKLRIRNVDQIESGAFAGSQIHEVWVEDERYQCDDGILYHGDELVYCFKKKLRSITIPNFVKRVCTGAVDSITELRQLSVLHSDIFFEREAVVNCARLNTIELVEISNKVLRELFDSVSAIRYIKYSGKSIKRKFFSHMDRVCEVQLIGVTEINDFAFGGDGAIETISGLNDVIYVGDMAFANCQSLKSITLSADCFRVGIGAFEGCRSLVHLVYPIDAHQVEFDISAIDLFGGAVPSSLNINIVGGDIPDGYFENLNANIMVTVSPEIVGDCAFKNSGLTQISLENTVKIGIAAFSGSKIGSASMPHVTHIGAGAFSHCLSLKSVSLNNSVELLGEEWIADSPVRTLNGAELGEHYRTNSNYLVDKATATLVYMAPDSDLTDVVIDKDVKRIASSAFNGSNVVSLNAAGDMEIETGAFAGTRCMETIDLRALCAETRCVPLAFYFADNRCIKNIKLHGGELIEGCFEGFDQLETVQLPETIRRISHKCFAGCKNLVRVYGLANVENFDEKVFEGCESLTMLELPFLGMDKERPTTLAHLFGEVVGLGLNEIRIMGGAIIEKAFADCDSIVQVYLPNGIEYIPTECFRGCSKLEKIINTEAVKHVAPRAFSDCVSLEAVALEKVEIIEDEAFASCRGLTECVLPLCTEQIGKGILNACTSLSKLTMAFTKTADTVAALGQGISNSLKEVHLIGGSLGKHAFAGCDRLEKVVLADSFKEIPDFAFAGCVQLRTIVCNSDVTDIGEYAFYNCHEMTETELPRSLSVIGKNAFANSGLSGEISLMNSKIIDVGAFSGTKIRAVSLGSNIETIKASVFENCEELESVVLTSATKIIESAAFSGCKELSHIPFEYMTVIGDKSFFKCEGVEQASLISLDTLGASAFEECKALERVIFNDSLSVISERAFAGCTSLREINIPTQLTEIGNRAFAATAMKRLALRMPCTLVSVGEYVFEDAHSPVIYVAPDQAAKWNPNWGANCKGHGLLHLFKKVITKNLKRRQDHE